MTFIVSGELDIANVDRLMRAIAPDAGPGVHLVLDFSRLDFMDCSVITMLVGLLSMLGPGGRLSIRRPSRQVRRVLEVVDAAGVRGLEILA